MEKINYEKIITTNDLKRIDNEDILLTISSIELNKLEKENYAKRNVRIRAREISTTGVYTFYTPAEQEFIAGNIMYDNDEFIKFLLELNISFENLEGICNTIEKFKTISSTNTKDAAFSSDYYKSLLSLITLLCTLAKRKFDTPDDYLTINKLMYLATYEKQKYLELEKQKIRKPQ